MSIRRVRDLVMRGSTLATYLSYYTATIYRAGWRSCVWQLSGGAETILFLPGGAISQREATTLCTRCTAAMLYSRTKA
jgi:hypothetical protein